MASRSALRPIVEFFPTYDLRERSDLFVDNSAQHQKALREALESTKGIYAFYNSEGEVIYIGKTERQNLWKRMRHSYLAEKARYERYYVRHPHQRFAFRSGSRVRRLVRQSFPISDVATFCSAYALPTNLIQFSEQLLIRIIPNDLINLRMEGNLSLRAYKKSTPKRSARGKR